MYKERTGGHNRSSTKEKRNTYPPLKDPAAAAKNGPPRGLPYLFRTSKVLVFPVKTDYNERDRNHDRKPD